MSSEPHVPPTDKDRLAPVLEVSRELHEAVVNRLRSDLAPLSTSLFGIKDNLAKVLTKSGQLKDSFRADSRGLRETVRRFEHQSKTIVHFAAEMDRSVGQLEGSSRQMGERLAGISQAIGQIDDVAERIKVLSINASIEAARAGHQGAGFKVISQEVRKLAEDTSLFSDQAEKTTSEAVTQIGEVFRGFIAQYESRDTEIHEIQKTTQELETFLKQLIDMIEGIFEEFDGLVGNLETNFNQVSPTLQQVEIGTQQIENTWKGIREFSETLPGGRVPDPSRDEVTRLFGIFSRHLTTPLEAEVVEAWARRHGLDPKSGLRTSPKAGEADITMF